MARQYLHRKVLPYKQIERNEAPRYKYIDIVLAIRNTLDLVYRVRKKY